MQSNGHIEKGHCFSDGTIVKDTEVIMDGIVEITLDDNTSAVWLSPKRLKDYAPDDIEVSDEGVVHIADYDAVLKWYDIEWEPFTAYTGKYRYKELEREQCAEQCFVHVLFKDGRKAKWAAVVSESGLIHSITTDDGTELKNLAELRATGIIDATLISEYSIVDF